MIRMLLVDDHPLFRRALQSVFTTLSPAVSLEEFDSLSKVQARLAGGEPVDLVLLDLNLIDCKGLEGLSALRADHPALRIVVMSASEDAALIARAFTLGADGFIPKSAPIDLLQQALREVLAGRSWTPPGVSLAVQRQRPQLTPTQMRIMVGLLAGRLNKQIAHEIGVTEATIKAHMTDIFRKLGVQNRTQAVIAARELDAA